MDCCSCCVFTVFVHCDKNGSMYEELSNGIPNLDTYLPAQPEDVVLLGDLQFPDVPEAEVGAQMYSYVLRSGLIVVNMTVAGFPEGKCQFQIYPGFNHEPRVFVAVNAQMRDLPDTYIEFVLTGHVMPFIKNNGHWQASKEVLSRRN